MKYKSKRGFTLIEVIIYIALFSVLLGTAFVTAYGLIENSGKLDAKGNTAEEAGFVLRKIEWALTGAENIAAPSAANPASATLVVTRYDGNTVTIRLNNNKIEIKESNNGNTFVPITTQNVSAGNLQFTYISPGGITAAVTIDGKDFNLTKYIRK